MSYRISSQYFIRQGTAITIAHRMEYLGEAVSKAALKAVTNLAKDHGEGGVIALDDEGNGTFIWLAEVCRFALKPSLICDYSLLLAALPLNWGGMYRGIIRSDGVPLVAIFADDELA